MPAHYRTVAKLGPLRLVAESDEWQFPNHLAGAGAIRSTGHDMMTFLKANMGRVSTPIDQAIQRSHQELFKESTDRAIGMNWIRSFDSAISQNIIWHNGGTGGFRTYLGFTEDRRFGVFVLANTASSVDALAEGILKALVREFAPGNAEPLMTSESLPIADRGPGSG
jgi:CubicO group peptidase (beta-lactamase class C family)